MKKKSDNYKRNEEAVIYILKKIYNGCQINDLERLKVVSFIHWEYLEWLRNYLNTRLEYGKDSLVNWVVENLKLNEEANLDSLCDEIIKNFLEEIAVLYFTVSSTTAYAGVVPILKSGHPLYCPFASITRRYFSKLRSQIVIDPIENGLDELVMDISKRSKPIIDQILAVRLTNREKRVIELRYGLCEDGGEEGLSLEDVGKMFNVTRERIRQIESKAIRKLLFKKAYRTELRECLNEFDGLRLGMDI